MIRYDADVTYLSSSLFKDTTTDPTTHCSIINDNINQHHDTASDAKIDKIDSNDDDDRVENDGDDDDDEWKKRNNSNKEELRQQQKHHQHPTSEVCSTGVSSSPSSTTLRGMAIMSTYPTDYEFVKQLSIRLSSSESSDSSSSSSSNGGGGGVVVVPCFGT
jgi:hypothetical protein